MPYYQNPYQAPYQAPVPDQLAQFRQPYQPFQQPAQQVMPQMQPPQQTAGGIIWVQGEEGAKAYMVAPGNSVLLMDSENNLFFIKSVDQSGMPSMRKFEYQEINGQKDGNVLSAQASPYVQKDEFEELKKEVAGIIQSLNSRAKKPTSREPEL